MYMYEGIEFSTQRNEISLVLIGCNKNGCQVASFKNKLLLLATKPRPPPL